MSLEKIIKKPNVVFIDVRHPLEFIFGRVKGAINIPLGQIERQVEVFKSLPKPVICYCRSGTRSGIAIDILKKHGVKEVYNGGGIRTLTQLIKNKKK